MSEIIKLEKIKLSVDDNKGPLFSNLLKTEVPKKEAIKLEPEAELKLSENALKVIEKRYVIKDGNRKPLETPEDMFHRVARHIAGADKIYGATKDEIAQTEREFYNIMARLEFLPNSPTFTGAGTKLGQLAACFVLPIEDDMGEILKTQMHMGLIHKSGGGTGFSFSRLRPKNDVVGSTGGISCGPIGLLQMYNDTTEQIKQGGTRRGANMGILRVDHPDILDFIDYKEKDGTLTNFNISVALTKKFMDALEKDGEYNLVNPRNGEVASTLKAKEVFDKIVAGAWRNGEPGVIFLDKINEKNPTPQVGEIEATNPCVTADTLIPTNNGLEKMGDIYQRFRLGGTLTSISTDDRVIGADQISLRPITKIFTNGKKTIAKIITKSGYELESTLDHKILTPKGWVAIKDLKVGSTVYIQNKKGQFSQNYLLPETKEGKLNLPRKWSKELGQILGLLVGDGWLRIGDKNCRVGFTFSDKDASVLKYAQNILNQWYGQPIQTVKRKNHVWHLSYHSQEFASFFNNLGVIPVSAESKEVPEKIFNAPKEIVIGFLQGLFTADGTVGINETNNTHYIRLTSKSLKLLKQTQIILINLGIKTTIYNRSRKARQIFPYQTIKGVEKTYTSDGICFELQISRENIKAFVSQIGFLGIKHIDKIKKLQNYEFYKETFEDQISFKRIIGQKEVFDLTEPVTYSFITNGFISLDCGEQPLLPYESCNLGAINLKKFVKKTSDKFEVDWEKLDKTMPIIMHFMDNVIDVNKYPIDEIREMTFKNRKVGITVMGFADMLYDIGVAYDSLEGIEMAEKIMGFIEKRSHEESEKLAKTRGEFPNFKGSIWDKPGRPKMHNAATTSCNPTGTLSIIGTASSGIEPFFALAYTKTVMDNDALPEVNEHFLRTAKEKGFYSDDLMKEILEKGTIQEIDGIPNEVKTVFKVASDIEPEWHVRMQAAFQKHTDGAISKTINFPNSATLEQVRDAYLLAYKLGCKGLTVYRDGSRAYQVLTKGKGEKKDETPQAVVSENVKLVPRERPNIMNGLTYKVKTGYGNLYVTINDDESGDPFEVFSHLGKTGGFFAAKAEAICRLISLALRSGVDVHNVIEQIKGIRGPTPIWGEDGKMVLSMPDAIAQILEKHIEREQIKLDLDFKNGASDGTTSAADPDAIARKEISQNLSSLSDTGEAPACPECGGLLELSEGCIKCPSCGYSKCA